MRAVLEFERPEDESQFTVASTAMNWALTVYKLDEKLRSMLKYSTFSDETYDALQSVRDYLHTTLSDNNIALEMIE